MLLSALKRCVFHSRIRLFVTPCSHTGTQVKGQTICCWVDLKCSNLVNPNLTIHRFLNTNSEQNSKKYRLPPLMWQPTPAFLFPLINVFISYWNIRLTIDKEFRLRGFISGAKQAVLVISNALASQNYEVLDGIVNQRAVKLLTHRVSRLTPSQRELLTVPPEHFVCMPGSINIRTRKDSTEKVIEIMIFGMYVKDTLNFTISQENFSCFSYVFQRKYIDGTGGSWIVKTLNHFAP